jgi:hypothetical protein
VEKPTRKHPLERLIRRWKDNIKMDLKVIGLDVDATISGWCSVECLCISNVEISGCATPVLVFSSRRKCHHNYQ